MLILLLFLQLFPTTPSRYQFRELFGRRFAPAWKPVKSVTQFTPEALPRPFLLLPTREVMTSPSVAFPALQPHRRLRPLMSEPHLRSERMSYRWRDSRIWPSLARVCCLKNSSDITLLIRPPLPLPHLWVSRCISPQRLCGRSRSRQRTRHGVVLRMATMTKMTMVALVTLLAVTVVLAMDVRYFRHLSRLS